MAPRLAVHSPHKANKGANLVACVHVSNKKALAGPALFHAIDCLEWHLLQRPHQLISVQCATCTATDTSLQQECARSGVRHRPRKATGTSTANHTCMERSLSLCSSQVSALLHDRSAGIHQRVPQQHACTVRGQHAAQRSRPHATCLARQTPHIHDSLINYHTGRSRQADNQC